MGVGYRNTSTKLEAYEATALMETHTHVLALSFRNQLWRMQ